MLQSWNAVMSSATSQCLPRSAIVRGSIDGRAQRRRPHMRLMLSMIPAWFRIPFWQRVLAGFVLGGLAGWLMGPSADTWFKPLGDLYITLIKMIAVP
jgi:hypothetical protein